MISIWSIETEKEIWTPIASDTNLSPGILGPYSAKAIIWTNGSLLSIGTLQTSVKL